MKNLKTHFQLLAVAIVMGMVLAGCDYDGLDPRTPGLLVPRTVDQDPSLPFVSVNGSMLHAEAFGNPAHPMIVVIHGGPGSDYRSLLKCKAFADYGYYVVFYDQRGCGLSQRHPKGHYSIDMVLDDLGGIIREFRSSPDQKVFLLGHSWGAMLATAYIDRHPTAIDGAILSEPGGFTWEDTKEYVKRTRDGDLLSEGTNDAFFFDQILTGKETDHEILDYKYALTTPYEYMEGSPLGNSGPTPSWRSGSVFHAAMFELAEKDGFDFTANLGQYATPVLFMYSDRNKAYGHSYAQHVSSAYPHVQLVEITGTGHDIPWFAWEKYFPVVLEYLNEL